MTGGSIFNIACFLVLIFFMYRLFKKNRELMFLLIPITYVYIWCIVSTIYLESGSIYINDLDMISSFNFSSFKLITYFMVFILCIYLSFHSRRGIVNFQLANDSFMADVRDSQCKLILLVAIFISIIWAVDIAISGSVLTNLSLTRFNYWSSYSTIPVVQYAVYFINPLSFALGLIFSKSYSKVNKSLCIIIIICFFGLSYLIGNQFSALIGILLYFIMPILFVKYESFTAKQKRTVVSVVICAFAVVGYIKIKALTDYTEFINRFLVLQGDLWFATDIHVTNNGANIGALFDTFDNLFTGGSYEMDYLMRLVMPTNKYTIFKNGNVALYSGFPAYEISIFGYEFTYIVVAIEGWIYGKFLGYINRKIRSSDIIIVIVSVYLLVQYNKSFTMCGFTNLFNGVPILCILFILFYESFISRRKGSYLV